MTISAWFTVALAIPVLLLGELFVRRIRLLSRFNIPAPVAGGLLLSLLVLGGHVSGLFAATFQTSVTAQWWTWLVTTEPDWIQAPSKNVNLPFLVAFFTCIGLNASWTLVRKGSTQVLSFLALAGMLAVIQNLIGVGLARVLGVSPLLGLVCGSVTMTGGHGTALGFAADLEKAGLPGAAVLGVAAATFGLVTGGLIGGPVGGALIRRRGLRPSVSARTHLESGASAESGILPDLRALVVCGKQLAPAPAASVGLHQSRRVGQLLHPADPHHLSGLHGCDVTGRGGAQPPRVCSARVGSKRRSLTRSRPWRLEYSWPSR